MEKDAVFVRSRTTVINCSFVFHSTLVTYEYDRAGAFFLFAASVVPVPINDFDRRQRHSAHPFSVLAEQE